MDVLPCDDNLAPSILVVLPCAALPVVRRETSSSHKSAMHCPPGLRAKPTSPSLGIGRSGCPLGVYCVISHPGEISPKSPMRFCEGCRGLQDRAPPLQSRGMRPWQNSALLESHGTTSQAVVGASVPRCRKFRCASRSIWTFGDPVSCFTISDFLDGWNTGLLQISIFDAFLLCQGSEDIAGLVSGWQTAGQEVFNGIPPVSRLWASNHVQTKSFDMSFDV